MKRGNGRGTVEFHRGKYRIRTTIRGKRKTIATHATEAEAKRMLAAMDAEIDSGSVVVPGAGTLRELGALWLDSREIFGSQARERVRSVDSERSTWRRHVEPSELAGMAVQSIRTRDVQAFVMWLRRRERVRSVRKVAGVELVGCGSTIAPQTQAHALRLVRQCLDEAIRRDLRTTNPAKLVTVMRGRSRDLSEDWLRADEIAALLGCEALSIRNRTAYACALGLALRLNDLKALELAQVHLDAQVPGPHVALRIGKTDKPHRVPIMPWLEPWLRAHVATLPRGSRWLFPTRDGGKYASREFDFCWASKSQRGRERVKSALELAGVDRRVRFHDLRGSAATHLALGTWGRVWTMHEIKAMLAHSDQRVTERYVRRAVDELAFAAAGTTGGPGCPPRGRPATATARKPTDGGSVPKPLVDRSNRSESAHEFAEPVGNGGPRGDSVSPRPTLSASLAVELLRAIEQGGAPAPQLVDDLLEAVLAGAPLEVRLALEVRAGGPHAGRRLVELCALLGRSAVVDELEARR